MKIRLSEQPLRISARHPDRSGGAAQWRDLLLHTCVTRITACFANIHNHRKMFRGDRTYFVYILASKSRVLYVGVTSRLAVRVRQHVEGTFDGFTSAYKIHRLVYVEKYTSIVAAIEREKQLKRWRRYKKVALIEAENPTWEDLSQEWGKPIPVLRAGELG